VTVQLAAPVVVADAATVGTEVVAPGGGMARWVSAADLFDSPTGFDPLLRDALYQWHEAHDARCCDPFGPFCPASLAYARACAEERDSAAAAEYRHAAYQGGDCVDCLSAPHSAGRPRCEACHACYMRRLIAGEAP
jgi:hypothetical protein